MVFSAALIKVDPKQNPQPWTAWLEPNVIQNYQGAQ